MIAVSNVIRASRSGHRERYKMRLRPPSVTKTHFIYLVLDEEDDRMRTLDDLQCKIEELQERRYYPQMEAKVYETTREEMVSDEVVGADAESAEEMFLLSRT